MARPTVARISSGPPERLTPNKIVTFKLAPTGGFNLIPGAFRTETKIIIESAWCTGSNSEAQHFKGKTLSGIKVEGTYKTYESSPGYGEIRLVDRPES